MAMVSFLMGNVLVMKDLKDLIVISILVGVLYRIVTIMESVLVMGAVTAIMDGLESSVTRKNVPTPLVLIMESAKMEPVTVLLDGMVAIANNASLVPVLHWINIICLGKVTNHLLQEKFKTMSL